MTVKGVSSVTLEVPDLDTGVKFYTNARLCVTTKGSLATARCEGRRNASIILRGGSPRKRLHHLTLRVQERDLPGLRAAVTAHGGRLIEPPETFDRGGVWLTDPHGMVIHLADMPDEEPLSTVESLALNLPGNTLRKNRSAMLARARTPKAAPLRLGHVLFFTPDVTRSVEFFCAALGMGLADRSQDVIAFLCCKRNSDHHVVAFAKSNGIGFHHASFEVPGPDAVGRAGAELAASASGGNWGFGRHTIGSNFFHYIQDPWGSWFEYFSDIDFIEDYTSWSPTNYAPEDALANWGPPLPSDFVHNYEMDD